MSDDIMILFLIRFIILSMGTYIVEVIPIGYRSIVYNTAAGFGKITFDWYINLLRLHLKSIA